MDTTNILYYRMGLNGWHGWIVKFGFGESEKAEINSYYFSLFLYLIFLHLFLFSLIFLCQCEAVLGVLKDPEMGLHPSLQSGDTQEREKTSKSRHGNMLLRENEEYESIWG